MQTDPIGYGDGMNMYGYVGGDPVNFTDPSGLFGSEICTTTETWTETYGQSPDGGTIYVTRGKSTFSTSCETISDGMNGSNPNGYGGRSGSGNTGFAGPQSQSQQAENNGQPTEIILPGSNETNMSQCDARNTAAGYARDFQSENNAELNVGLISRGNQWGYTNGITSWQEGTAPVIPNSFVPSGATLRGSVHSHPDNFANSNWRSIPITTSRDASYALQSGGLHFVVTPDSNVRRIQGFVGTNGYYVRSGTVTSCG